MVISPRLKQLLVEHPDLATARLGDDNPDGMSRTLLHVATDWPGHLPDARRPVAVLVEAGADGTLLLASHLPSTGEEP